MKKIFFKILISLLIFFPFFRIEIENENRNYPLIILLQYESLLVGEKIWNYFVFNK